MFWLEGNLTKNFDDKYDEKSVQLVRVSSFRNDLLQNPYFWQATTFIASWLKIETVVVNGLIIIAARRPEDC